MNCKQNMWKSKSGSLTGVILILAVLVILLLFSGKLLATINKSTSREACRISVLTQSVAMFASGGNKVASLDCPTYNLVFYNNQVKINDKPISVYDSREKDFTKKFDGLTDEIVNQAVAEELKGCWYQFLEGKRSIFDMATYFGNVIGPDQRLCYVCDEISFDNSVAKETFSGFYDYTKNTPMINSNMTYYQYYAEEPRISLHTEGEKISIASNDWEAYFADYIKTKLPEKTFTYLSQSPDFNFNRKNRYAVTLIRRGYTSRAEKAGVNPLDLGAHTESYFAYVFPISPDNALPNICSRMLRGSQE